MGQNQNIYTYIKPYHWECLSVQYLGPAVSKLNHELNPQPKHGQRNVFSIRRNDKKENKKGKPLQYGIP